MKLSIPTDITENVLSELKTANLAFQHIYPGEQPHRQPVHTVYGGANLFKSDTTVKMGQIALKSFKTNAPNFAILAKVLELTGHESLPSTENEIKALEGRLERLSHADLKKEHAWLSYTVYKKIAQKLEHEGVEDFRIDFEDGFGNRPDKEEDETAVNAAKELAKGMKEKTISPFIGIRIKPFTEDLKMRGIRTLDIFLTTLLEHSGNKIPGNFVVMLPKVTIPEQIEALVKLFETFEKIHSLPAGCLKMEMMVEATQAMMDAEGKNPLLKLIRAGKGRCIAAHFGTYDYTASCNITAKYQTMDHPVCDFAHHMTRVALGNTGIMLSDGATNVMPVGPHRGDNLTLDQEMENRAVVHKAWKLGYGHTMHSLINGFYQGWDLNPAQLPMRYAATYTFFLESYEDAAVRLRNFVDKAAQATLSGDVFDDAATGQGLLNYFLKAMNCGAITEKEATMTGLTVEEIRSRSFYRILVGRRK
ncbi:MAG: phosphoenolpyruvate kinase [Bacteroidetes bacterium]|nr:phosphoenolpyruvate kinase [Bacteroidota bacterium]